MKRALALLVLGLSATARAEERRPDGSILLKMASPAPEGTAWAREGRAFARDVEKLTNNRVHIKYYLGSITGDEVETEARIRRGQLDGIASGGMLCMKLAPSLRVMRLLGVFQSREESAYVSGRLRQSFDEEFAKAGYVNLGELGVGPDVLFSRAPIRSMADLRRARLWVWDLDEVYLAEWRALGVDVAPAPINLAGRAYDEGRLDGFVAGPTAALAFQWSAQARYVSDLRVGFLRGCFLMNARTFDALPVDVQQSIRVAHAHLVSRLEELGRLQDQQLLDALFEKQGLRTVAVSGAFRAEFFDAAREVREHLSEKLVPKPLLQRVLTMLADFRAEHAAAAAPAAHHPSNN